MVEFAGSILIREHNRASPPIDRPSKQSHRRTTTRKTVTHSVTNQENGVDAPAVSLGKDLNKKIEACRSRE